MKRVLMAGLLVAMAGCGLNLPPIPWPAPTPTPTPTPAEPPPGACPDGTQPGNGPVPCPTPTPVPAPTPTPTPTPTPAPEPTPPPPPPAGYSIADCPKPLADGATVYLVANHYPNKAADPASDAFKESPIDSSVRVAGDPEFCRAIHGVAVSDCHLEGWPKRAQCESALLGGCAVWQYKVRGSEEARPCLAPAAEFSCDHFGSPSHRDDPLTPLAFEGEPLWCALQRDVDGNPMAGAFTAPHGDGFARPCKPGYRDCGPWVRVDR